MHNTWAWRQYTITDDKVCEKDKFNLKYVSSRFEVLELLSDLKLDIDDMTNVIKGQLKHNVEEDELVSIREKLQDLKASIENMKK